MNNFQVTIKKEPNPMEIDVPEIHHDDEDPGSRCGEIYVGNNAKKWTFICTFCDKSMRNIEEFISHIKHAHVNFPPPLPVDPHDTTGHHQSALAVHQSTLMKLEVPLFNTLDKQLTEYVDYNDFLDVNVQTVPDVILSESNGHQEAPTPVNEPTAPRQMRIKSEPESEQEAILPAQRNKPPTRETTPEGTIICPTVLPYQPPTLQISKPRRQKKSLSREKQIKGPVYCTLCKRTFRYHSLYRNHMVKHTSETPFQCTTCKKGFKSKQAIRYHMTTHQRQKNHICEVCTASFHHEWQLVTHIQNHKSESQHPCEVCGKMNRTKFEKDVHMRTHTGDRPFACEFCSKRFRLRHHLSNHLKLHQTYRCDFCRKQFRNGVSMKKPYYCPDCSGGYPHRSDDETKDTTFRPVRATRDPEAMKPHTCKICNKTYVNKRGLSVHITTKH